MKREIIMAIFTVVLALSLSFFNVEIAYSADATGSVGVTATVSGIASLAIKAKNVSNNQEVSTVAFGNVAGGTLYSTPSQYVEIGYASNADNWAIEVYTNNTTWTGPANVDRGGLIGQTKTDKRVPMLWQVHNNPQPAHPTLNQAEVDAGHWTWVKDKGDPDWATSGDYRQVLAGNATWTWLKGYPGGDGASSDIRPVVAYLGGKFEGVPADNYSTTLIFDLYHW